MNGELFEQLAGRFNEEATDVTAARSRRGTGHIPAAPAYPISLSLNNPIYD
jgi:hypothetical protein